MKRSRAIVARGRAAVAVRYHVIRRGVADQPPLRSKFPTGTECMLAVITQGGYRETQVANMLESNNNTTCRSNSARTRLASAFCIIFGAGLGCSSEPAAGVSGGGAGAAQLNAGNGGANAGNVAGGSSNSGGASSSGLAGSGNAGSGGNAVGSAGSSGLGQAGATPSGGSAGSGGVVPSGAAGGSGGNVPGGCTRELLKATIDSYFKALAAHDASTLPLADTLKFTENGKVSRPADAPLWKTAGALKYVHSALDPESCNSASEAVVPDGTTDIPVAVRIKLVDQKITEIETIAARQGDYTGVTSNTAALAASKDTIKWEEPVPAAMRNTREELTSWMAKYFKQFPQGVCNTTSTCKRMENGGGNFVCNEGAGCAASSTSTVLKSHLIIADVETGLGVGFTLFTGGHPDMHLFKMYGGQVYAVSAILSKGDSTGWD